jgi:thiol-disulfide isomerase/thioredoxin
MGLNLKEKLQSVNKKNVLIVALVLLVILLLGIGGFEYYQYHKFEVQKQKAQEYAQSMPVDLSGEPKKPSEYNIGVEYNQAMKSKKPVLVLFYADWCRYCIKFMPVYQVISEKYADNLDFSKVNVEDKKYEKLVNEIGITGFPTVYIIDPKYDNRVLLSNAFLGSPEQLSKELDRYIRVRKLLDGKKK